MVKSTYKHLEDRLKIGELTPMQWFSIFAGVSIGLVWAMWISPLPTLLTIGTAFYIGGVPALLGFFAGAAEFNLAQTIGARMAWRRNPGRYGPGGGEPRPPYLVKPDPREARQQARQTASTPDLLHLWD
jgi:hypothetical protein